jgi:RHS repeat-associated protein
MLRARWLVVSILVTTTFYTAEAYHFTDVYAMDRQERERLEEISERMGLPVERLERDNPSLLENIRNLISDPEERFRQEQLDRLEAVIRESEEQVAANPYRPQIENVKNEHRTAVVEGVIQSLSQLGSLEVRNLPRASRRALLRGLRSDIEEGLQLSPLPEGLPATAQARHQEMQARLTALARGLGPTLDTPRALEDQQLATTLGRVASELNGQVRRRQIGPRFTDRPLPVRQIEREAEIIQISDLDPDERATPKPTRALPGPAAATSGTSRAGSGPTLIASEISDLAASLGNSPARIFAWVHDTIRYDPKWGQVRSPLGTLLEETGTSWDQAVLLVDLLTAAGVEANLEWGEIEIPAELLLELTGTEDARDAGGLLATGGVPIVLVAEGARVVSARLAHVWVKAHVDYVPDRGVDPGPPDTWIRMDPSLKRYVWQEGIAIHQEVPFSLGSYLQSGTPLSPRRFHEEALWAYIQENNIVCTTLEQLKKAGSILGENFPYLPGTLRGRITRLDGEATEVPAAFQHRVRIEVKEAEGGSLLVWEAPASDIWDARVEIAYAGATADDQITLDSYGGVFSTPPYLVDLEPSLRLNGVSVAEGAPIGSARETEVWVTLLETNGETTVLTHDALAGEHHLLALDFGHLPQQLIDEHLTALAAAVAAGDTFEAEAETLHLLGVQYLRNLGRDLDDMAGWKWQRLVKLGTEGLVSQTGIVTTTVGGTPLSFRPGERHIDIARMILGIFPADGDDAHEVASAELLGAQSSYLEGEIFNQVLEREGIASVSALTRAVREGQNLTQVDSSNVDQVLAQIDLDQSAEAEIALAVAQGKIAWVPESPITVNLWAGTGYVLENPSTGGAAYLISGSLAGGSDTGDILGVLQDLLGSESWLEGSPLGELLALLVGFVGGGSSLGDGDAGPATIQSDPINLSTGNLWFSEFDITLQARGLPIVWSRTYNSRSSIVGPFGHGWTFSFGEHLAELGDGSVLYREADGTEHIFSPDGSGGYDRPAGKHLELVRSAAEFTIRTKNGLVSTFALDGRLLSQSELNGNTVTLNYDGSGVLTSIADAAGRTVLTIANNGGKITQVTDLSGRSVSYTYTSDDLVSVSDTMGESWSYAYDSEHNLLSRTDPLGNTDSYAFDTLDRCVRHVDPLGEVETFAYSSIGRSAVLTDRRGYDTFLEFDERGRAHLQVDPLGNALLSAWDEDNNRTSTTDPRGGETTRTFDGDGDLLTETNPLGDTRTWTYDSVYKQVLAQTDPSGHVVTNTYDEDGNLKQRTQLVGGETLLESFVYDQFGQLIEQRDANGNLTTLEWDATKGSLESQTDALGQRTAMTTDDLGRVTAITDPENNALTVVWDDKDRLSSSTDPFGNTTSIGYDASGRQVSVTTSRGTSTTEYDAAGRAVATSDVLGSTLRTEYDPAGNPTARIDAKGNRTTAVYDPVGRVLATVDPLGHVWSFGYCAEIGGGGGGCSGGGCASGQAGGKFCELTDPLGNTIRREFDALGRATSVTDPLGNDIETIYDGLGRSVGARDALGNVTHFEYDEAGRLAALVEANGARTEFSYDGNGNLVNVYDAEGRDWSRTYDASNQLVSESNPMGHTTTYTYNALGNLASKLTPTGDLITYDYDVRRLVAVNLPGDEEASFVYDLQGRLTSMASSEVSVSYLYDFLGRLEEVTNHTLGQTINYAYDGHGNLREMEGPAGTVEYFYDAKNRLVEQRDPVTGIYRFAYDQADRRIGIEYPNGLATEYAYDSASQLTSILTRNTLGEVVDGYEYTYDLVGNRTRMALLHDSTVHGYQYDSTHRLTRWDRGPERFEAYTYDNVGNRLRLDDDLGTISYSYDTANRLLAELRELNEGGTTLTSYAWDANGNVLHETVGSAVTTYQWDALNRLLEISNASGVQTYGYDPNGIRVRETNGTGTQRFQHSFEDIVGTYDDSLVLSTYYTHGPSIDEPLAQATPSAGTSYLHRDALGSLTALSLPSGQEAGARSYAPFGDSESSWGLSSRFGYTSREDDPTGLVYYRARYFEPKSGRFLSKDPWPRTGEDLSGFNEYAYASNNPALRVDPSGLVDWKCSYASLTYSFALFPLVAPIPLSPLGIGLGYVFWDCSTPQPSSYMLARFSGLTVWSGLTISKLFISYTYGSVTASQPSWQTDDGEYLPNPSKFTGFTFHSAGGGTFGPIGFGGLLTVFDLLDEETAVAYPGTLGETATRGFDLGFSIGVGFTFSLD